MTDNWFPENASEGMALRDEDGFTAMLEAFDEESGYIRYGDGDSHRIEKHRLNETMEPIDE
jgi:hypothetical protein